MHDFCDQTRTSIKLRKPLLSLQSCESTTTRRWTRGACLLPCLPPSLPPSFFFFFSNAGEWDRGFLHSRQVLCHLTAHSQPKMCKWIVTKHYYLQHSVKKKRLTMIGFLNGELSWITLRPSQLGANIVLINNSVFAHEIIPKGSQIQRITWLIMLGWTWWTPVDIENWHCLKETCQFIQIPWGDVCSATELESSLLHRALLGLRKWRLWMRVEEVFL